MRVRRLFYGLACTPSTGVLKSLAVRWNRRSLVRLCRFPKKPQSTSLGHINDHRGDVTEPNDDTPEQRSPWVKAGVFGALGFEFLGFTLVGVLIGEWLDQRFDIEPWGLLGMLLLAFVTAGIHIFTISKRFLAEEE